MKPVEILFSKGVSARPPAEEALRQSREEFKDLFDNAPVGFHEINAEGRLVRINNTELKMLGYSAEELLGQFVWKISADEETSRRAALEKLGGTLAPPSEGFERMFRRKDGSTFPVWINDQLLKRKDGVITGIRASVQDITERKRAEEAHAVEHALLRAVIDLLPDYIYAKDTQHRFLLSNESCALLMGAATPAELLGKTDADFYPSEQEANFRADELAVLKGTPLINKEEPTTRPDGTREFILTSKLPLKDGAGKIIGLVGCGRIITERKRAEEAVRENERRFQTLAVISPVGIFRTDAQGQTTYVNPTWCEISGLAATEALGVGWLRAVHPDDREKLAQGWQAAAKVQSTSKEDYRFVHPDGTISWVMGQAVPEKDPEGRLVGYVGTITDITERNLAELALRDNEAFLNTVIEKIPQMIFVKDAKDLRFVKFNEAGQDLLGYSLGELIGKNDFDLFPKEQADYFTEKDRAVLRGKEVVDIPEETVQTREKEERILHTKKIPIFDSAGQLIYLMGISEDITQQKQTEAKVHELQALYHSLVGQMHAGIFRKDAAGRFIFVNPWYCELKHMPADQILGRTAVEIADRESQNPKTMWPVDAARQARLHHEQIMQTGQPIELEENCTDPDGQPQHLHLVKSLVFGLDGRIAGTQGIVFDITERKRAEQQLDEALNFSRTIISDAAVGITAFNASGQCVLANETAARILDGTVPRLLEMNFRQIASWSASGMLQVAEQVLATKKPRQTEFHFVTTFGKEVWLVSQFSHFVQNGESHLLHVFNDVSEMKKLEIQFLRTQRMESIGTLAGGIAHDLNNVLAPLLISVQLLKEKVTDAAGKRLLETLEANVNRGASLVKQVLIFGRGIKGERIPVQPRHIGQEIGQIVRETFPKSLKFEIECAADLWTVTGDPTQIEQVLMNLCVNARDAMPGGGKLSLRMENTVLDENQAAANLEARPGRHVVISVTDTGAGMTREIQDRIFEPFFTTKELGKGTGLGLSTTMAIVKSHGGFINCYSEPGKGSVFKVYLPASPDAALETQTPAHQSSLPRGHNELVLVVDDEEPIRNLAQTMLERFGYRVLLAANGAEAVQLYTSRRNEIALVITDMAMPVMDGPATIAALQAINPDVKVIGSSGLEMNDGAAGAVNTGLRHFMPKPYTAETMLTMLLEVLRENPVK